jgi:hypothetical protein
MTPCRSMPEQGGNFDMYGRWYDKTVQSKDEATKLLQTG